MLGRAMTTHGEPRSAAGFRVHRSARGDAIGARAPIAIVDLAGEGDGARGLTPTEPVGAAPRRRQSAPGPAAGARPGRQIMRRAPGAGVE
jgi:hypothetical protein